MLTRKEAKEALEQGKKLTHISFMSSEYIYQHGIMIFTEEGYSIDQEIFWKDRNHPGFDKNWSIYK